jgi:hypothetical protein
VLRQIVLVRKKRSDTTQLQNTLASIQNRKLIYARKVFATMSSDELKNGSHDQRIPFCGCHSDNY